MADLRSVVIAPPFAGLDTSSGPGGGTTGTVPVHRNFLPHFPAKARQRGPLGTARLDIGPSEFATEKKWPFIISGAVEHDDTVILGYYKETATNGNVFPWNAPHMPVTALNKLALTDHTRQFNLKTGVTENATAGELAPILKGERLGPVTYFLNGTGIGGGVKIQGRFQLNSEIKAFDGENIRGLGTFSPIGAKYLKTHLERLWVFGGSNPFSSKEKTFATATGTSGVGEFLVVTDRASFETLEIGSKVLSQTSGSPSIVGATVISNPITEATAKGFVFKVALSKPTATGEVAGNYVNVKFENPGWTKGAKQYPNALWYSAQEGPLASTTAPWSSPVSGLVNKIVVGNEENDYLVGGAVVNQNLVIFKRHSIWILTGYSPETFVLRQLTGERGCVEPWTICEANGGVYFCSQTGFEFFDGSEFHTIDNQVSSTIRSRMLFLTTRGENGEEFIEPNRVQIEYFGNGYLFIGMQEFLMTTNKPVRIENYLFHINSGNWTEITSNALFEDKITFVGYTAGLPWVYDGKWFRLCPYTTNPEAEAALEAREADPVLGVNKFQPIPAEFETDRIDLSGNGGYTSQLHRFMMDYQAFISGLHDAESEGFKPIKVTLIGDNGAIINNEGAPYEMIGQGSTLLTALTEGRRFTADTFTEAVAGVKLLVQPSGTMPEGIGAQVEIFDTIFELQTARQRRRV